MTDLWIFILVIAVALVFDFTNGFHDTANSIAAAVGTRAMKPKTAVVMAALLNFVGALISIEVAMTVGKGVIDPGLTTMPMVLGGVVGAITWNIITWYFGLPSSSSHALVGGMVGAGMAGAGPEIVKAAGVLQKVAIPALIAPTLGFVGGFLLVGLLMHLSRRAPAAKGHRTYRKLQWISAAWLSLTHGMNDAQKTMGIMFLATITYQNTAADQAGDVPMWIRLSAATAMAFGTYAGGWRLIKTLGSKVVKMQPVQGFAGSTSSASVLFMASQLGIPVSTTHTVTGGVLGVGAGKRASAVRWSIAGEIAAAWVMTLPMAAAVGAAAYWLVAIHPFVLLVAMAAGLVWLKANMNKKPEPRPMEQGFQAHPPAATTVGLDPPARSEVPRPNRHRDSGPDDRAVRRPSQTSTLRQEPRLTAGRAASNLRLPRLSTHGTIMGPRRRPVVLNPDADEDRDPARS